MAKIREINECFEITGVNPLVLLNELSVEDFAKLNPKVYQWLIWWKRRKEKPDLKFETITDEEIDYKEIREAIRDFFLAGLSKNISEATQT